jgi:hypothetical protein
MPCDELFGAQSPKRAGVHALIAAAERTCQQSWGFIKPTGLVQVPAWQNMVTPTRIELVFTP